MRDPAVRQGSKRPFEPSQEQASPGIDPGVYLDFWIESFLYDRKSQNMSPGTISYYQVKLRTLMQYCKTRAIDQVHQLTADELRRFMTWLEEQGHNPGGRHALYRAVKTFLRWYELEAEPENWKNPIRKIKAPRVATEPLDPIPQENVKAMMQTCNRSFLDYRDKAILLGLLDTGARASEFLDLDLADVNQVSGEVLIRQGKGRKPRTVYFGAKTRRAIRAYLKCRHDDLPALWVTDKGDKRLEYFGLRTVIHKRAKLAKVKPYGAHAFRRQFAISMLRAGVDLATLARLMGHSSVHVLLRYLKQIPDDMQAAHLKAGPVDHSNL